jgi:hypothetical protein
MTDHLTTTAGVQNGQATVRFPLAAWTRANGIGLSIAFALFALVGEGMEAVGAEHDTVVWGVPTLTAMVIGGTAFGYLRRRALGADHRGPRWRALLIGVGLTAGFALGLVPPLDFALGILAAGTTGGVLQLRHLWRRLGAPGSMFVMGAGAWLLAALIAIATAILLADVILAGTLDLDDEVNGAAGFVGILALIGLVGGAIGGATEGAALRRRQRQ